MTRTTGLLSTKLRRDVRASWTRFALMVLALAVCLTVAGGMLYARTVVARETTDAYLSTEPASATIVLDQAVDPERMRTIASEVGDWPGVLAAAGRTQFDTDLRVNGQERTLRAQTFVAAADDPMRVARFDLGRDGSWPPAPDEILLGRDSLELLDVRIGDTLTIQPPGRRPVDLRVAGTVYDPSLAPSPQYQKGHAYLSADMPLDQLKLQLAEPGQTEPSRDRGAIVAAAGDIGTRLQRDYGLRVAEIQVPAPYSHPHQWQADVLLLALLAGSGAALLLSAVLVATMLNNLFARQIPQIGIMKAIGARSRRIARHYLAMTLLVAAVATALAILPAVLLGRRQVSNLVGMLGIEPASLGAPWWVYALTAGTGLGLPPMLALPALVKTSRTTVRRAIDHHGGSTAPSSASGLLARLSRARRLDRGLLMALRNTVRRPGRFWLSVGLLAAAGSVFVAGMSLRSGTEAADQADIARRYWDVDVELSRPAGPEAVDGALRNVQGVERAEIWYRARVGVAGPGRLPVTRTYPDQGHGSIELNTIPANAAGPPPTMIEGRWLTPGERGAVVLSKAVRDKTVPDLGAGDTAQLVLDGRPTTWRIAGIADVPDSSGSGVSTTADGLAAATGQQPLVNRLRIITAEHDEPTRQAVADRIGQALTAAGIEVESAASVARGTAAASAHLGPVLLVLLAVALPLGLIGAIGLAATTSANVLDRIREFAVMHAIGGRPATVRRIVAAEAVLLALTSCLVAIVPALTLTAVLGNGLGNLFGNAALPFRISAVAVVIWIALAILGAVLASDAAAVRASRVTVREAISQL